MSAGPLLLLKAYTAAPNSTSVRKVQIRLKSSWENCQRDLNQGAPSRIIAMVAATNSMSVCHPQNRSAAPRSNKGGFMSPRLPWQRQHAQKLQTSNQAAAPRRACRIDDWSFAEV